MVSPRTHRTDLSRRFKRVSAKRAQLVERLETRVLFSVASKIDTGLPTSDSQQHLSDLSLTEQIAISSALGKDDASYHAAANRGGFTLANSANAFAAQWQAGSLQIASGSDNWSMSLEGLDYGDGANLLGVGQQTVSGNRVDIDHGSVDEWYINGPSGLEQGFNVMAQSGDDSLTLQLGLGGSLRAALNSAGDGLSLTRADGSAAMGYNGLIVQDATGRILPASMELKADGNHEDLLIHVNTVGAEGQITVDPIVQLAKLTASDGTANNYFGYSVAMSGSTAVVGAYGKRAAYVFTASTSGWATMTQTAKLTATDGSSSFGCSVGIGTDANAIIVGDYGANSSKGAAYVFVKSGSAWANMTQTLKLIAADGVSGDFFGSSVGITGATGTAVVGAYYNNSQFGAAYVYTGTTNWASTSASQKLTASDGATTNWFGNAVAIDGTTIAVGSEGVNGSSVSEGAAYVFTKGSTWVQAAKLTASDHSRGSLLGHSVAVSGTTVVVGAYATDVSGHVDQGAVYVFTKGSSWANMTQTAKLTSSDGAAYDYFGNSVAISGTTILVGAYQATVGSNTQQGAAYMFNRPGTVWASMTETAKLTASDGAASASFGRSVGISGTIMVAGASQATVGSNANQGAAYVFGYPTTASSLALSSSGSPSNYGQTATYTATVTGGSGTPTGTVQFKVDGTDYGSAITLTSGTATTAISTLSAGGHTITASYSGNATYVPSSNTYSQTVNKLSLTVTAGAGQNKVYGAADPVFTYMLTSGSLVGSDSFSGNLSRAAGENVGSYAISLGTLTAGGNYNVTLVSANFLVTAKSLGVTADAGQNKIYGAADPSLTYTLTSGSLVGSDAFSGSETRASGENIGTYAISQGTLTAGSNYAITFVQASFAITTRSLTVTANSGQSKIYGSADPALAYTVTSGSLVGSDTFSGSTTRVAGESVGSYAISQGTLALSSNYALSFVSTNFSVVAKSLTVTATSGQSKVYGAVDPTLAYSLTSGSLVGSDAFSGSLTRVAGENVGSYAISQGTLTAGSNYAITFVSANFQVAAKALTVTANSAQGKVYGSTDPALTYTLTTGTLVGSDAFSGSESRAAGENVGSYAISQGTLTAGSNYAITFVPANFSITAKGLTVTATAGQSKVYGSSDPTLAYTLTLGTLVGSDAFSGSLTRTAGENVGSYAISQGTLTAGSNYSITFVPANFSIAARGLTVTATSGKTKVYGAADPALTYGLTAGSLVGADAFSGNVARATGENAGSYAIGQGTLAAGSNYSITFVPADFAITARNITITADAGKSKVYGNSDPALTYAITAGTLVGADTLSGSLSYGANGNVGVHAIGQGTLTAGSNYAVTFVPADFTITPRSVTVAATAGQSKVYGNADPAFAFSIMAGSLVGSDGFSGNLTRAAGTNVGTYAIGQGTLSAGSNYTLSFVPADFAITVRSLTVTASAGQGKSYGDVDPVLRYRVTSGSLVGTDNFSGSLVRDAGEDLGSYAIQQGTLTAGSNYSIAFVPGTFTITESTTTSDIDSGGLHFHVTSGAFTQSGYLYTSTADVQVGLSGQPFSPMAVLSGTTSIDSVALQLSTGSVTSALGTALPLLPGGLDNADITQLSGSGVTGLSGASLTVADTTFALTTIAFHADASTGQPVIQLQGALSLPGGLSVGVSGSNWVDIASSGMSLTGVSAELSNQFAAGGVTFDASHLAVTYASADDTFTLTGTASTNIDGLGSVSVDFGSDGTSGVLVQNGSLISLDMTVTGSLNISGVTVTAKHLELSYAASTDRFTLAGDAGLSIAKLGNVDVTFGHDSTPGLVLTNGALTSLDMTVNSTLTVSGLTITAKDLELTYTADTDVFTMTGNASVALDRLGNVDVVFGHDSTPGLVIANGSLTSLDMTITSTLTVSGLTITAKDLELTYTASPDIFTLKGTAAVAITKLGDVDVTFGHDSTPGMVLTHGSLTSLDMTVTSTLTISGLTITAKDLELTYTATTDVFTMKGNASVAVGKLGNVDVAFGHADTPGMVLTHGSLASLDMTVTSTLTVSGLTITAKDLELTYTATTDVFTMQGNASVAIEKIGNVDVTFGHDSTPGMVITSGALTSLDMTVTSTLTVSGLTITAKDLELTYTAGTDVFTLKGNASIAINKLGNVDVTLGHADTPGMVITSGALTSLDMTVNSTLTVSGLTITAKDLELTYTASTDVFTLKGNASVAINKLGNVDVTFGHDDTAGMVITNGALTSLDMTVTSTLTVSGLTITAKDLELTYTATTDVFTMKGNASVAINKLGNVDVTFGHADTPGMVITGGALTSLDMTVTSTLTVSGLTITAKDLELTYTATTDVFTMKGNASVAINKLGNVDVTFGHDSTPGMVITAGALTSLDMTVTSTLTVSGLTITAKNLELTYTATTDVFTMKGNASVAITKIGNVDVTFGHDSAPGLVITSGALTSLDMTVNSTLTLSGLTLTAKDLELIYTASTDVFTMKGNASVAINKLGNVDVTFGHGDTPGLVITAGSLTSMDMTVTSTLTISGLTITAKDLELTYTASTDVFTLKGNASVAITKMGNVDVTFGHADTPGMVLTHGSLTSLDMTVNSTLTVSGLTFTAKDLELTYAADTTIFTMKGNASVAIEKLGNVDVTFGHEETPGLVLTNGSLTSMDMTVTGELTVSGLTITAKDLEFKYTAVTDVFTLAGTASVAIKKVGDVAVTFGHGSTPGLVITRGKLTSLDMTVNSTLTVSGLTFTAKDLELTYVADTDIFTLKGTASVAINKVGNVDVTFGHGSTPGLVITAGSLTSLDMTVNSTLTVSGLTITAKDLEFTYTAATDIFTLQGTASVAITKIGNVDVTFGHGDTPGLVITKGSLTSMDMTVNSTLTISGLTISAKDLEFTYAAATDIFTLKGTASVAIKNLGNVDVTFGHADTPGLVVTKGSLTGMDMTVNSAITLGSLTITAKDLEFTYVAATDRFTLAGTAGVAITNLGNLDVTFGHGSTPGLVIAAGSLVSLDMTVNSSLTVGGLTIATKDLELTYTTASKVFTLGGTASVAIPSIGSIEVTFGHGSTPGLVISNGALVSLDMTVNSDIVLGGVTLSTTGLEFKYTVADKLFAMTGTASVTLPSIGSVKAEFGHAGVGDVPRSDGLVVQNGKLKTLDMTLTSNFKVFGLNISTTNLNLTYSSASSTFMITTGTIAVSTAAQEGSSVLNGISATFGDAAGPGLAITSGKLTELHIALNGSFTLYGLTVKAQSLTVDYSRSTSILAISGGAEIEIAIASFKLDSSVWFPTNGLTINTSTGQVQVNGFDFKVDFKLGGMLELKAEVKFSQINGTTNYYIAGSLSLPVIGEIGGSISISKTNGKWKFNSIDLYYDAGETSGINLLETGLYLTHIEGDVENIGTPNWEVKASLSLRYGPEVSFGGHDFSLFTFNAKADVSASFLKGSIDFEMIGGYLAKGKGTLDLEWARHYYYVSLQGSLLDGLFTIDAGFKLTPNNSIYILATAGMHVPDSIPVIGGWELASVGLYFQYIPTARLSRDFGAGWIHIWLIGTIGGQLDFNGKFTFINGDYVNMYKRTFSAQDGPISGGTVFGDLNENGVLDDGEPSTTTAFDGSYSLSANEGVPLVEFGGTDISTNLPNNAVYTAPANAMVISPLTTLVNCLMKEHGMTESQAEATIDDALGLSPTIGLISTDLVTQAEAGVIDAAHAFAVQAQVANLAEAAGTALGSAQPLSQYMSQIYSSLAGRIALNPGMRIDLSDAVAVQAILVDAAEKQGVALTSDVAAGSAFLVATLNAQIAQQPAAASRSFLESVVRVQIVAQGTMAPMLSEVADGSARIDDVMAAESAATIAAQVSAAQVGELKAPTISVDGVAKQVTAAGTTYTFTVSRDSTVSPLLAVSVDYSTLDITALDGVDYTGVQGTLTWAPGEMGAKTVEVFVAGGVASTQAAKVFGLSLSNAQNAMLVNDGGLGTIVYNGDTTTSTTLSASSTTVQSGDVLTLTATPKDSLGQSLAQYTRVTFYDGETQLGVAYVSSDGTAQLTVSNLGLGAHHLTVAYAGTTDPSGATLLQASSSSDVTVTIGKLDQTINFPTLSDIHYGSDPVRPQPVLLKALSSSGLPVTYNVISGPATVVDNLLTITGVGRVTVEATQAGDNLTYPATSVEQSFDVTGAPLTFTVYDVTMQYGETIPQVNSDYSGFLNGDTVATAVTVAPTISILDADGNPVVGTPAPGTYRIVASGAVTPNYQISYVSATLTVNKASLIITAQNQTQVYGAATPKLTFTCAGLQDGDTTSVVSGLTLAAAGGNAATVGSHPITIGGGSADNYDITYVAGVLTVTPAHLEITAQNQTQVYGAATPTLTYSISGLVNGDTSSAITGVNLATATGSSATVGVHQITIDGAMADNYDITLVPGTLTVTRASLVLTASDKTQVYGSATPQFTFTCAGLRNGDTASVISGAILSTSATSASPVGTYSISIGGAQADNYGINYVPATLAVTRAPLVLTAASKTQVYGTATPQLTFICSGLLNGDTSQVVSGVNLATVTGRSATAGSHVITISGGSADNYAFTYVAGTLTVLQAAPSVTLASAPASIAYDGTSDVVSWATTVLAGVNGDVPTGSAGVAFYYGSTVSGTAMTSLPLNAGTYTAIARYAGDANYSGAVSSSVTFTVSRANCAVVLPTPPATITYDGTSGVTAWVKATLVGPLGVAPPSGTVSYAYYSGNTATGTALSAAPVNAGTYTVVGNYPGNSNYLPSQSAPAVFTIQQPTAPLSVFFKVDDGTAQRSMVRSLTATFSSAVTLQAGAITLINTGTGLTVPFTLTSAGQNAYVLTFVGSQFTGSSLANGRYALTVHAANVAAGGSLLASDQVLSFWRLFGDIYGTASVNAADKTLFTQVSRGQAQSYLQYFLYDGGSVLDAADTTAFNQGYGKTI